MRSHTHTQYFPRRTTDGVCMCDFIVHQLQQLLLLVVSYSPVTTTIIIMLLCSVPI